MAIRTIRTAKQQYKQTKQTKRQIINNNQQSSTTTTTTPTIIIMITIVLQQTNLFTDVCRNFLENCHRVVELQRDNAGEQIFDKTLGKKKGGGFVNE